MAVIVHFLVCSTSIVRHQVVDECQCLWHLIFFSLSFFPLIGFQVATKTHTCTIFAFICFVRRLDDGALARWKHTKTVGNFNGSSLSNSSSQFISISFKQTFANTFFHLNRSKIWQRWQHIGLLTNLTIFSASCSQLEWSSRNFSSAIVSSIGIVKQISKTQRSNNKIYN